MLQSEDSWELNRHFWSLARFSGSCVRISLGETRKQTSPAKNAVYEVKTSNNGSLGLNPLLLGGASGCVTCWPIQTNRADGEHRETWLVLEARVVNLEKAVNLCLHDNDDACSLLTSAADLFSDSHLPDSSFDVACHCLGRCSFLGRFPLIHVYSLYLMLWILMLCCENSPAVTSLGFPAWDALMACYVGIAWI